MQFKRRINKIDTTIELEFQVYRRINMYKLYDRFKVVNLQYYWNKEDQYPSEILNKYGIVTNIENNIIEGTLDGLYYWEFHESNLCLENDKKLLKYSHLIKHGKNQRIRNKNLKLFIKRNKELMT